MLILAQQRSVMGDSEVDEFLLGGVLGNGPAALRDGAKNSLSRLSPQSPL